MSEMKVFNSNGANVPGHFSSFGHKLEMWSSLCNFLYDKLFYKAEVKSRASGNDTSLDPLYGKRLKFSHPDCDTNGLLIQTQTPQRIPMQAKENLTNYNDEEECCVIAEIPRRKIAGPSSTTNRKYGGVFQEKSSPKVCLLSSPSFPQRETLQNEDDSKDIEIVKFQNNSENDLFTKTPNRSFKFFNAPRISLSQSKQAKSRMIYKLHLRKKLNFLQESYRLTEKLQYMQLLQSHTSCNILPTASLNTQHQKKKFELQTIPIIDLTEGNSGESDLKSKPSSPILRRNSSDDQDVQFIREIPGVRSFEDIIKINPVNTKEAIHKMLMKHSKNSEEVLNLTDLEQNPVTLVDDKDDNKKDSYSESLEEKLRKFMQITGPSDQEVETYSEEQHYLPELTPEQEKKVEEALKPGFRQEVLAEGFGIRITRRVIGTLSHLNWLNDEIINFYMNLIMERSQKNNTLPKVYALNTFFYPKLLSRGHKSLRRWTKQVDIFSFDLILVPVHLGLHWCLCVIDFRCKSIKYYDSIGTPNNTCLEKILSYLKAESLDKKHEDFPVCDWDKSNVEGIPQQMNGSDCGVFTCTFAEHLARDSAFLFSQDNMPYFRKKMVVEILEKKLLT